MLSDVLSACLCCNLCHWYQDGGSQDGPDQPGGHWREAPTGAHGLVEGEHERSPEEEEEWRWWKKELKKRQSLQVWLKKGQSGKPDEFALPRRRVPVEELPAGGQGPEDEGADDKDGQLAVDGRAAASVQPDHVHDGRVEGREELHHHVGAKPERHGRVVLQPLGFLQRHQIG